ncbi:protein of unknown function [Clostridium beijerinckii]|nr:protein of unknown function [Clostridium beijerinckii]
MIKLTANFLTKYLSKNNSCLTENDLLKVNYSLQVILGDLSKLNNIINILISKSVTFVFLNFCYFKFNKIFNGRHSLQNI